MEDKKNTILDIFNGIENILDNKTVVGEPIVIDSTTIIPLNELSCGMGIGEFKKKTEQEKSAGGMSIKLSPIAVLIIQNGYTKLVNIKNQDSISKLIDMLPDLFNKLNGKNKKDEKVKNAIDDIDVQFINEE